MYKVLEKCCVSPILIELEELERLGQKAFKKFPSTGGGLPQAEDMKSPRMLGSGPWPGIELVRGQYTTS